MWAAVTDAVPHDVSDPRGGCSLPEGPLEASCSSYHTRGGQRDQPQGPCQNKRAVPLLGERPSSRHQVVCCAAPAFLFHSTSTLICPGRRAPSPGHRTAPTSSTLPHLKATGTLLPCYPLGQSARICGCTTQKLLTREVFPPPNIL